MAFWGKFFKRTNLFNRCDYTLNSMSSLDGIILVKHVEIQGQIIDVYATTARTINLYQLEKLCDAVGWVRRPLKKVQAAIDHSFLTICLFYKKNSSYDRLIGFARATSDTVFNATIWDVVIHPTFQKKGLGAILVKQTVLHLRYADISTITLFADPQVVNFYCSLGFLTDPDGIKGMFWYPC
uniref:N-acetyltransferase domain-containing protein n=1 Tax=Dicranema revolutum TaxID=239144 RepID=A0A4D6WRZ3_9FLOR|nr:hypothetical protein [Dicranema revolutum]